MPDFVGFEIQGLRELESKLGKLPQYAVDAAADEAAKYILEVLKAYPPPRRVTRKAAYGRTFQSRRQQKYFFWALGAGIIRVPYRRTQGLRNGWQIVGSGEKLIIANEEPAAYYTMDNKGQARLNQLVGWKKVGDILRERRAQMMRRAEAGVQKAIRKAGL